jgi:hypothetical protein
MGQASRVRSGGALADEYSGPVGLVLFMAGNRKAGRRMTRRTDLQEESAAKCASANAVE